MAEHCGETCFLPCFVAGCGTALRVWGGGKGEIPDVDAVVGEILRLPGGFLLPDVQPLSSPARGPADGGWGAFG